MLWIESDPGEARQHPELNDCVERPLLEPADALRGFCCLYGRQVRASLVPQNCLVLSAEAAESSASST